MTKRKSKPNIRGKPLPDGEVERGAKVTRKVIEAELEIWKKIPELARYVDANEDTLVDEDETDTDSASSDR